MPSAMMDAASSRNPSRPGPDLGDRHVTPWTPRPPHEPRSATTVEAGDADGGPARRPLPATGDAGLRAVAALAARLLSAHAAEVCLVGGTRTIVAGAAAAAGSTGGPTSPEEALCTLVARGGVPSSVEDAGADVRVAHLGPVTRGEVGAYLGVPLVGDDGQVVGALCVLERSPRRWSTTDHDLLQHLAPAVAAQLQIAALDAGVAHADRREVLAGAAHAAGIGSFTWDVGDDVLVWDGPLLEVFGYDETTFSGTIDAFSARLHPDDAEPVDAALRAAIGRLGEYAADFRVVRPDGTTRWLSARGRAHRDPAGRTHVLGAVTDVTALREQEARVAAVLEAMPVGYLGLDADWRIAYVNAETERVAGAPRRDLVGRDFWRTFPATVGTVFEDSYRRAVRERVDVVFDAYYPAPLDVWVEVRAVPRDDGLALYFVDVTDRRRALEDRDLAARRLRRTAHFALALGRVATIDDLVRTVAEDGLAELGCNGGSVAAPDPEDPSTLVSLLASSYGAQAQQEYGRLDLHADLPVAAAARTGRAVLVADRDACLAYSPEMGHVLEVTGSVAFASLPLRVEDRTIGVVTAGWDAPQTFDEHQLDLLETFAAQVAQALGRLQALDAERAAAAEVAGLSAALQRSLLTELPEPDHLELVARYVPAADAAQVGGDWYDAFTVRDGSTCLVVGDVTGHDRAAAVQMAQVRNLLRGTAHALVEPPAAVLGALDGAMRDLAVGALATAVLARVEQGADAAARGLRTLRWSNAGHPPPLLLTADGHAEFLRRPSDLLLGLGLDIERHDHTRELPPGSTVLLFTDGLVERRGEDLDHGLERLRRTAAPLGHLPLQELCDELLQRLAGDSEDDVALLALRAHPEDRPRPAEAGPGKGPADLVGDAPGPLPPG
ncbi:PAS domain S-box-containing protein [Kineococcus rhizosphaerae]|uniref:protein-serine/threonine phosphatase n=1 Tax=Kineococcus rhizosphaerae TaxID=559628 RepID=A0A2T0R192_9ACTN|nr:PAS domain S-box-containing protein [Kineococcus rhizosphaerae]